MQADASWAVDLINGIKDILDALMPILVALALAAFFWGLIRFIAGTNDAKARYYGKGLMVWGVIALFVMVSVWGIVSVIGRLFNIEQIENMSAPSIDLSDSR